MGEDLIEYYFDNKQNLTDNQQIILNNSIIFWEQVKYSSNKKLILSLLASVGPFLGFVLLIILLSSIASRLFTIRKKYKRKIDAKNLEILENFLVLVTETNDERLEREQEYLKGEIKRRKKSRLNLGHVNNYNKKHNLNLPDENKVPIVLVNKVLAKSVNYDKDSNLSFSSLSTDISSNEIKIDEEVVEIVNELVNPNLMPQSELKSRKSRADIKVESVENLRTENEAGIINKIAKTLAPNFTRSLSIRSMEKSFIINPKRSVSSIGVSQQLNYLQSSNKRSSEPKADALSNIVDSKASLNQSIILSVENKPFERQIPPKPNRFETVKIVVEDYDAITKVEQKGEDTDDGKFNLGFEKM
jgi:hypothetical protein